MSRGRPKDPDTPYKVGLRKDKKYRYAVTQEHIKDENTGKIKQHYIQWGTVTEDLKFIPGYRYKLASQEERDKLIFPPNWNLEETAVITGANIIMNDVIDEKKEDNPATTENSESEPTSPEKRFPVPAKNGAPNPVLSQNRCAMPKLNEYNSRLYGAVWMFEELADNCGLFDDLIETFQYNIGLANEILALAVYPYVGRKSYSRFARWQNVYKTQVSFAMYAPYITKLTQSITDNHRMGLIKRRIDRLPNHSLSGLDSTTRSAWGKCLADIRWGVNKDNKKLKNTVEVYAYSLTEHEPFYYRSFAGNTMDMSTVRTILSDLIALGFDKKEIGVITDRGYPSNDNLARFVAAKIPFLMCSKVNREPISQLLVDSVEYDKHGLPLNFGYDKKRDTYYAQLPIPTYVATLPEGEKVTMEGLKVNLFLKMSDRCKELEEIRSKVEDEEKAIKKVLDSGNIPADLKQLNSFYDYFKIVKSRSKSKAKDTPPKYSIVKKEDKIRKEEALCGYFCSLMYIIDQNAYEALETYKTRDEEEKSHELIKDQLEFNTQDNSSEEGKDGRSLILFCGAILASKLRYGWKNTNLSLKYPSSLDVMDAMETIQYSEYAEDDNPSHMTSFTQEQFDICLCLGLTPPRDCLTEKARNDLDRIERLKKKNNVV